MKIRLLIIIVLVLVVLGLFILPKVTKKQDMATSENVSQEQPQKLNNIDSKFQEAEAFQRQGSLIEAKEIYQRLMESPLSTEKMSQIQSRMENLNIDILLSGINIENSQTYEVQPGDSLYKIAKNFNTTVETIAKANNIKQNAIRPGMKLRILKGNFSVFVDKSQNILILKFNDEVIKTYIVSTGKNNCTPVGTFKIVNKLVDPVWYKDGQAIPPESEKNILGTRWLGFDIPEYGIHGTRMPEQLGMQVTEGCVRMKNEDVEELYNLIPTGTEVAITD